MKKPTVSLPKLKWWLTNRRTTSIHPDDIDFHSNQPYFSDFENSPYRSRNMYNYYLQNFLPIPRNPIIPAGIVAEIRCCFYTDNRRPIILETPFYSLMDIQNWFLENLWSDWKNKPCPTTAVNQLESICYIIT